MDFLGEREREREDGEREPTLNHLCLLTVLQVQRVYKIPVKLYTTAFLSPPQKNITFSIIQVDIGKMMLDIQRRRFDLPKKRGGKEKLTSAGSQKRGKENGRKGGD